MTMENRLTTTETGRLKELEAVIERGRQTFIDVGYALAEIREANLYRQNYSTFEDYCCDRWEFSRSYAHRLSEALGIVEMLPIGNIPPPDNEAQTRELAPLKDNPESMAEAWQEANESSDGQPTAKEVKKAVDIRLGRDIARKQSLTGIEPDDLKSYDPVRLPNGTLKLKSQLTKADYNRLALQIAHNIEMKSINGKLDDKAEFRQAIRRAWENGVTFPEMRWELDEFEQGLT
jgi:hypothetical protein